MATKERWVELMTKHRDDWPDTDLQPYVLRVIESAAKFDDLDEIKAVIAAYHELTDQP